MGNTIRELVGGRDRNPVEPSELLRRVDECVEALANRVSQPGQTVRELKTRYAKDCRRYYQIAAFSRRKTLHDDYRTAALKRLYRFRALLENVILDDLIQSENTFDTLRAATVPSFFGKSLKQGVSIRYALASCVPTESCGGRCYAHDGRDRELHHIFRGVLNYYLGSKYERENAACRETIVSLLDKPIEIAIAEALKDQLRAREAGFVRPPRIRFSHVGEMVATPGFTNALAFEIRRRNPNVQCVLYTRHPDAQRIDSELVVVNFTLEGDADTRRRFVPDGARIVSTAWDGKLAVHAEVNFLEHHVNRVAAPDGVGNVCPVTLNHDTTPSCDSAMCDLCFNPPSHSGEG